MPEPEGVKQPNAPPLHCKALPPEQVLRPNPLIEVPKKLVVLAVVLKKLVEVALVVVELMAVKFCKEVEA